MTTTGSVGGGVDNDEVDGDGDGGGDRPPAPPLLRWAALGAAVLGPLLALAPTSALWLDEALTVNIARLDIGEIGGALRRDGHPPLFYYLLHAWMEVFGTSDGAVRLLSTVLAAASMPLAWQAGKRLGGPRVAWCVLLLYGLSPFLVRYASETRQYALLMLLVWAGYLAVHRALERSEVGVLVAVSVVTGLLALTHYWSFWLLGAVGLGLLHNAWKGEGDGRRAPLLVAIAIGAGGLLFVPWLPNFAHQAANTGTPWGEPVTPQAMIALSFTDLGGIDSGESRLLATTLVGLVVLGLFGRWRAGTLRLEPSVAHRVRPELAVVTLVLIIATLTGYASGTAFQGRYAAAFYPLVVLLAAWGLSLLRGRALLVVACGVIGLSLIGGLRVIQYQRTQAGVIADGVADELLGTERDQPAPAGAILAVCPDQLGPGIERAVASRLGERAPLVVSYPDFDDPQFVDWVDYAARYESSDPAAFAARLLREAGPAPVLLVWNDDYRSVEGYCLDLHDELEASGRPAVLLRSKDFAAFENANLSVFRAG